MSRLRDTVQAHTDDVHRSKLVGNTTGISNFVIKHREYFIISNRSRRFATGTEYFISSEEAVNARTTSLGEVKGHARPLQSTPVRILIQTSKLGKCAPKIKRRGLEKNALVRVTTSLEALQAGVKPLRCMVIR